MSKTIGISPKLAGAIGPPLTAVVTAMILTDTVDRTSLAALAAILIGAALGYHAPVGRTAATVTAGTGFVAQPVMGGTMSTGKPDTDDGDDGDDHLPAELATRDIDPTPVDEVDVPDLNHPEVN
ncbi:MAG TPA: hypothetical protein VFG87_15160 [Amycolatopsis sp.]|jgi:hypothetical protein|nr:hypothetical protein [Amycolatopsis sp.]